MTNQFHPGNRPGRPDRPMQPNPQPANPNPQQAPQNQQAQLNQMRMQQNFQNRNGMRMQQNHGNMSRMNQNRQNPSGVQKILQTALQNPMGTLSKVMNIIRLLG